MSLLRFNTFLGTSVVCTQPSGILQGNETSDRIEFDGIRTGLQNHYSSKTSHHNSEIYIFGDHNVNTNVIVKNTHRITLASVTNIGV